MDVLSAGTSSLRRGREKIPIPGSFAPTNKAGTHEVRRYAPMRTLHQRDVPVDFCKLVSCSAEVPTVHYQRNLLGMVGHAKRKELGADLRAIFAAPAREEALRIASSVANKWRGKGIEKVAKHIEERIEECLTCLAFPESHRRRIRTTNSMERLRARR
jgi:hypothetical protein